MGGWQSPRSDLTPDTPAPRHCMVCSAQSQHVWTTETQVVGRCLRVLLRFPPEQLCMYTCRAYSGKASWTKHMCSSWPLCFPQLVDLGVQSLHMTCSDHMTDDGFASVWSYEERKLITVGCCKNGVRINQSKFKSNFEQECRVQGWSQTPSVRRCSPPDMQPASHSHGNSGATGSDMAVRRNSPTRGCNLCVCVCMHMKAATMALAESVAEPDTHHGNLPQGLSQQHQHHSSCRDLPLQQTGRRSCMSLTLQKTSTRLCDICAAGSLRGLRRVFLRHSHTFPRFSNDSFSGSCCHGYMPFFTSF